MHGRGGFIRVGKPSGVADSRAAVRVIIGVRVRRDPPPTVKQALRQQQGFACVVPYCRRPYLEYHHFDPPWRERHHHDPGGMVGLCPEHHRKADNGSYEVAQLHEYKRAAASHADEVRGEFEWLRRDMVLSTGSVVYVECGVALQIGRSPVLWFNRDPDGYALLNVRMPQSGPSSRVHIEDNSWVKRGNPVDLVCPPGGKSLEVTYRNGDQLGVEFFEVPTIDVLREKYPTVPDGLRPPFTAVDVMLRLPGLQIALQTSGTRIAGLTMKGVLVERCAVGIQLN